MIELNKPTELETLRYLFAMLQGHLPDCRVTRSLDFTEDDCTCSRAQRLAAIQQFIPPRAPITPEMDAADSERRNARQDRLEGLWSGHIPVDGDAALLLTAYKGLGQECGRLNTEISRALRTIARQEREIARLRRELYPE